MGPSTLWSRMKWANRSTNLKRQATAPMTPKTNSMQTGGCQRGNSSSGSRFAFPVDRYVSVMLLNHSPAIQSRLMMSITPSIIPFAFAERRVRGLGGARPRIRRGLQRKSRIKGNAAHQPPRAKRVQHETKTVSRGQAACACSAVPIILRIRSSSLLTR